MKKIWALIIVSGLIAMAGPVSAVEQNDTNEKELCILYARDCADKLFNLQEKIRHMQNELAKGATVYRADEIKKLKEKLKEAEDMMYALMPNSSSPKETK
ncbi:hypothetical protein [Geobacter argillaceus]|jgi:hypothetical protein|uniref:Uncharacterized protein n=1 Tax=Geobacter argillaceus TaxID=345631 RepID=A0A562VFJ8_9BACT|nr:hypothetical protein [Geobacter argillaceus]TWJ16557.1 hypothetical protein JN12_03312 [Geobacter argillaceus]